MSVGDRCQWLRETTKTDTSGADISILLAAAVVDPCWHANRPWTRLKIAPAHSAANARPNLSKHKALSLLGASFLN
jgi:hypothetical protein